jgi:hypothetical protein
MCMGYAQRHYTSFEVRVTAMAGWIKAVKKERRWSCPLEWHFHTIWASYLRLGPRMEIRTECGNYQKRALGL